MSISREITEFVVREYLPGTSPDELEPSYDLLDTGVVDSLALLRLIGWVGDRWNIAIDDVDISPDHFRSVDAISEFVEGSKRTEEAG